VQMGIMPIVGVCQEGCAAECPQYQHRYQHRREQTTSPRRPNTSVQGGAASGGSADRHQHGWYRSDNLPSTTVADPGPLWRRSVSSPVQNWLQAFLPARHFRVLMRKCSVSPIAEGTPTMGTRYTLTGFRLSLSRRRSTVWSTPPLR
jgi:hypothetical protein